MDFVDQDEDQHHSFSLDPDSRKFFGISNDGRLARKGNDPLEKTVYRIIIEIEDDGEPKMKVSK